MDETSKQDSGKVIPPWATAALQQMLDQTQRLFEVYELSCRGISMITQHHKVTLLLKKHRPEGDAKDKADIERAKQLSELAEREVSDEFPVLNSQVLVTLWAYLEACVRRLAAEWIHNEPECLSLPPFQRLKVRLAEYELLEQPEKSFFVLDALEKDLAGDAQHGIGKFESLLAAYGLSGEVPPELRKVLYELGQVRNVVIHRASIVDKKLARSCQWLKLEVGATIKISNSQLRLYNKAVHDYVGLLICRLAEHYGGDANDDRQLVVSDWVEK